jgi:hypothetical protein
MIAPDRCGGKSLSVPLGYLCELLRFIDFRIKNDEVRHFRPVESRIR